MYVERFMTLQAIAYVNRDRWVGEGFWRCPDDGLGLDLLKQVVAESLSQSLDKLFGLAELRVTVELATFVTVKAVADSLDKSLQKTPPESPDRITWTLNRESKYERREYRG